MRSFIVMAMFIASLTHAAMNGYTETRNLELGTNDVEILSIVAGAGSMDIKGVAGATKITVKAVIEIADSDVDDARINIEVKVPQGIAVIIDDGSGSIRVGDVEKDLIIIDDGSGSLTFSDIRGVIEQDT